MTRRLAILLALGAALAAAPAWGATYYVSPTGDSLNSGLTAELPKTLQWANLNIRAGDVCYLLDGTYADKLQPGNTGTSGSRITFIGDISTPGNVSVEQVQIDSTSAPTGGLRCGGFVTVKGVHSRTSLDLKALGPYDHTDSVLYCSADIGMFLTGRGKTTVRYCTFGDAADYDNRSSLEYNVALRAQQSHYVTGLNIIDNTFYVNTTAGGTGPNALNVRGLDNCTFTRNRVFGTVVPTSSGKSITTWYYTRNMTVEDCYFEGISHAGPTDINGASYLISLRDGQQFNVFERDTFFERRENGVPGVTMLKVGTNISGNPTDGVIDVGDRENEFHNCFFKVRGFIEMDGPAPRMIYRNNVFVTQTYLRLGNYSVGYTDSLEFRHNTVASFGDGMSMSEHTLRASTITQNIFYVGVDRSGTSAVTYNAGRSTAIGALYCAEDPGVADSNLVFMVSEADSVDAFWGCELGGGGETRMSLWCIDTGNDCNSVWGAPAFADSAFWTFDPKPHQNAKALSASFPDGYAGAINPTRTDSTDPTLLVDWPSSASPYAVGGRMKMTWTCSDNVAVTQAKVFYATAEDGEWNVVTTLTGSTSPNTYTFYVPRTYESSELHLRVVVYDAEGNDAVSQQNFSIDLSSTGPQPSRDISD